MKTEPTVIDEFARALADAASRRHPIAPLRDRVPGIDADVAYAIQDANTHAAVAAGRRLVGRKIGLTSLAVQQQLGVDRPDYGMLFANMAVRDPGAVALDPPLPPQGEAEVALVLGRDLTHDKHTYADLMRATEYVAPAIEIVDSRIERWDIRFVDTVADNASSGLFVLGSTPKRLADVDVTACAMRMTRGTEIVSSGSGRACLGSPLTAAAWLADVMVRCGRPLLAGDIVLTGALGPMVAVSGPARFDAHIEGLGSRAAIFV